VGTDELNLTPEQVQAELDQRLRGHPGFVGTGRRAKPIPTVIIYVGPGWTKPADVPLSYPGVRVEIIEAGTVRPL
jgi:hypothetical protein